MSSAELITESLRKLDNELYELVKGINILDSVSPVNYRLEKTAFFESNFSRSPEFAYSTEKVDSFCLKRSLFNLPVDTLAEAELSQLYSDVIESYVDKIDQYKSIGTPDFLYESFRYYGEPSEKDIRNANFILHLPDSEPNSDAILCADEIVARLEAFARAEGYQYQIKLEDSMIANALVSGNTVKVNSSAQASETEVDALAHHELGVHLVTTLNARSQPLKILSMGCPVNTMTQEGLAILSEYLAGCMTLPRLKVLALRVLAVESMVEENDFKKTFLFLKEQHNVADD
ncbi:tyrosine/phenylalanine carboxypeptidase domain-containing protein, partial [Amphritea sp.]|uniref:tyrosine/phenylalanine carboxypeptidase domain-containing protein n=1 Tax=Amphritea sp. TaxID=1872502 RepID=UPI003564C729